MQQFVNCLDTIGTIITAIQKKQGLIYLRYGDGDFNISTGRNDMLAVAHTQFSEWMNKSMSIRDERVMIAIPHHSAHFGTLEQCMRPGNHEYPGHFVSAFMDKLRKHGELHQHTLYTNVALCYLAIHNPDIVINLHKQIKLCNVLYIGNNGIPTSLLERLFGQGINRIDVPFRDAYFEHDKVFREFDALYKKEYSSLEYFVIVMASGCAGRAFSAELYFSYFQNKPNFLILDYGSLLDYLNGHSSRAYMDIDPPKRDYILDALR